jgi:YVTN family beta-propeller protein
MVLSTKDGSSAGEIADTAGVHGVALASEFHKGFTSNGRAGTVTVFDTGTLKVLGTIKAGENPDALVYEPATKRVWVFNGRSKDATVINAEDLSVASTVPLGGKPEAGAVDGKGGLFVNIEDTSEIVHIDAAKMAVLARWPLAPAEEPTGLAIDAAHHRLFAGCGNQKMAILDSETGKVLATPAIGKGVDGVVFDPATQCALSSNGEGTLSVVSTEGEHPFQVVQTLQTTPRARTIALDPKAHRIYLPTADFEPAQGNQRPAPKPGTFRLVVVGLEAGAEGHH